MADTEELERRIRSNPSDTETLVELAEGYRQAGFPQRAINVYVQAADGYGQRDAWQRVAAIYKLILLMDPDELSVRSKLADVLVLIGLRNEAQDELLKLAKMYQSVGNLEARDHTLRRLEMLFGPDGARPHCAFCGLKEEQVRRLIVRDEVSPSGSEVAICDVCVKKCGVVLQRDGLW